MVGKRTKRTQNAGRRDNKRPGGLARMRQLRDSGQLTAFQSAAGKKGYKATMDRYGKAAVVEKIAEYRRHHPSAVENLGHRLLYDLGFAVIQASYYHDTSEKKLTDAYTEHIPFPNDNERAYILDVAWPSLKIALEFDGPVHRLFLNPKRDTHYTLRNTHLTSAGWCVFHISSDDLLTDYGASILAECVAMVRERAGQIPTI